LSSVDPVLSVQAEFQDAPPSPKKGKKMCEEGYEEYLAINTTKTALQGMQLKQDKGLHILQPAKPSRHWCSDYCRKL